MSVRERRRYWVEKRFKKDKCLTFVKDGRSRSGLYDLTFECRIGKPSRSVFGKSKIVFGGGGYSTARFEENYDFVTLKRNSKNVDQRLYLRGCKILFDDDPFVLVLELVTDEGKSLKKRRNKKKKKNENVKHIMFKKLDALCWFNHFIIEKLDCKFVSRRERSPQLEARIDQKLTKCMLGGSRIDRRIFYDPDFIRHHFLTVHPIGIRYRGEEGWRVAQFEKGWDFHLSFNELNYSKTRGKIWEEIFNPLISHDYILDEEGLKLVEEENLFHISCSALIGDFHLDFTKFGLVIPRRKLYYPLGGNVLVTLQLTHKPPLLQDAKIRRYMPNVLSEMISEYNTKYVFESSSKFINKISDPDLKERTTDLKNLDVYSSSTSIRQNHNLVTMLNFTEGNVKKFEVSKILIFGDLIRKLCEEYDDEEEEEENILEFEKRTTVDFVYDVMKRVFMSQTEYPRIPYVPLEQCGVFNGHPRTYPEPNGVLERYLRRIREEGYVKDTNVKIDPELKHELMKQGFMTSEMERKVCTDAKDKNILVFKTHLDLDNFFGTGDGARMIMFKFPELHHLLQCIDRVFWCRHFRDEEDIRWKPREQSPQIQGGYRKTTGCPFGHPKRYWMGYVSGDYLGAI